MSEPEKEKIIIFDAEAEPQIGPDGRPIQTRSFSDVSGALKRVVFKANEITVDQVQRNVTQFLSNVQNILAEGAAISGEFKIDTVEVDAKITAEGKIGLMGTQVGMSGSTGIKFVFKRIDKQI